MDALKDPAEGYYDPRDPFTTVPRASVLRTGYADHVATTATTGALSGRRIGVIRESMVYPEGSKTEEPIVTAADKEIKSFLGDHLGATLVESSDPRWRPDPEMEQMKLDFRGALARLVPLFMPELLFRLGADGKPVFKEFAAAITPTEFLPRQDFWLRHPPANRLSGGDGRGPHQAALQSGHRNNSATAIGEHIPASSFAISDEARARLEGEGL